MGKLDTRVCLYLTEEQSAALEMASHRNGRSKSRIVRDLIDDNVVKSRETFNPQYAEIDKPRPVEHMTRGELLVLVGEIAWAKEHGYDFERLERDVLLSLKMQGIVIDG